MIRQREGMMTGFLYRRAIELKNIGERMGWGWLIRIALALKEVAYRGKIK